jgi:hypothetical protein
MSRGVGQQLLITSNLSVNSVHGVNKVVNPHKDKYYHYVGGFPPTTITPEDGLDLSRNML